ncbi:TetR family transcriptional regulator [Rhizobium sp. YS-1r]|uniref:TetR family transcriptional regulator n=1 Tax=Rhizobium sp. YS-1r TaxID=1532558 RepID=UPI00050F132A|nr:TetR family transcriptional regulator [Rhizobium sp. YS-1r]KGE00700.1 TetR family transcriptional regulator [Rhizobium sp. YS-1r]
MTKATGRETEGRRERKRRQTRERIEQAAISLFLERGFEVTTVEDITERADVSKRSFFDYFPSKEDVVFAWQDGFAEHLMRAIASRPVDEPVVKAVQYGLTSAIVSAADERALRLGELIRRTPVLNARDQFKYAKLEAKLTEALKARSRSEEESERLRLLAAVVIGALRVASERWAAQPPGGSLETFAHRFFADFWKTLIDFGSEGLQIRSD